MARVLRRRKPGEDEVDVALPVGGGGDAGQLDDADEAEDMVGDVVGGDIGAEGVVVAGAGEGGGGDGAEVGEEEIEIWGGGVGLGQHVEHAAVGGDGWDDGVEEPTQRRRRREIGRERDLGEVGEVGIEDLFDQVLTRGEMAVEGADSDARRGRDRAHIGAEAMGDEDRLGGGDDLVAVAEGILALGWSGIVHARILHAIV